MRRDQDGMAVVMVAVTLVVVVGSAALALDIGAIVAERRDLQSGADAAVLAVADDCASAVCGTPDTTADNYADANADDADSNVDEVCGEDLTATLVPCAGGKPSQVPAGVDGWALVTTSTKEAASGSNQLTFGLAKIFAGASGKTVHATAIAAWGRIGFAKAKAPFTIATCEYDSATMGGTVFSDPSVDPPVFIYLKGVGVVGAECATSPPGGDLPGGFGWLDGFADGGACEAGITSDDTVSVDTGVDVPHDCDPMDWIGKEFLIPIFDSATCCGTGSIYHIEGFARFVVNGYRFTAINHFPAAFNRCPTAPSARCIRGHFVDPSGGGDGEFCPPPSGSPPTTITCKGAKIVKMVG